MTPYHLASRIGLSTRLVLEWTLGTAEPNAQQFAVLTRFFGCDLNLESASRD
jgi:ribosome-binding protein aMBF1 (putative translation factor)